MDRTEHSPRPSPAHELPVCSLAAGRAERPLGGGAGVVGDAPRLALVSPRLALTASLTAPGEDWANALGKLVEGMGLAIDWSDHDRQPSLIHRARQVIGSPAQAGPPVFAVWHCWSPTAFQTGVAAPPLPRAWWAASYLFDSGAGRPAARPSVDLVLMSPLPAECEGEDSAAPALPRMGVLKAMLGAARCEGRRKLAIIVREANRNALAASLVAACDPAMRPDLAVEILSIEQAAVQIQSNRAEWDAVIAMPQLRGIVHAMLGAWSGVSAPWPMLWHDRELVMVTGEGIARPAQPPLDASLLLQGLALAARKGGCDAVAERLHRAWAALRDRGVATPSRPSPIPYAHAASEAEFVDLALASQPHGARTLPAWTGIASGRPPEPGRARPARLALVASR